MVKAVLVTAIVTKFASRVATAAMIIINTVVRAGPKIQPNSFYKLFCVVCMNTGMLSLLYITAVRKN